MQKHAACPQSLVSKTSPNWFWTGESQASRTFFQKLRPQRQLTVGSQKPNQSKQRLPVLLLVDGVWSLATTEHLVALLYLRCLVCLLLTSQLELMCPASVATVWEEIPYPPPLWINHRDPSARVTLQRNHSTSQGYTAAILFASYPLGPSQRCTLEIKQNHEFGFMVKMPKFSLMFNLPLIAMTNFTTRWRYLLNTGPLTPETLKRHQRENGSAV